MKCENITVCTGIRIRFEIKVILKSTKRGVEYFALNFTFTLLIRRVPLRVQITIGSS